MMDADTAGSAFKAPLEFHWDPAGRRPNLVAIIAIMVATMALSFWFAWKASGAEAGGADVRQIPHSIGEWIHYGIANGRLVPKFDDDELTEADTAQIGADSTICRQYINVRTHQVVQLYVVYRRYGRREFNHNPDQCFPAGGYQLLKRDAVTLPWAGESHMATHMLFDGSHVERSTANGQLTEGMPKATVTYFFASGSKTEYVFLKQQLWMSLERFIPNRNGWALIRLNTPQTTANGQVMTDEDALQAQRDFLQACGNDIRNVITTDKADDPKAGS